MLTTVVGSYPVILKEPKSLSKKVPGFLRGYDKYKPAIELAVKDQIEAGVDIISDGQVRGGMVEIFASTIYGMAVENKTPKIVGKIMPSPGSILIKDLKYAKKVAEKIQKEYGKKPEKTLKEGNKGVKGILTGPSTLIFSSRLEGYYSNKEDAIMDIAYALKNEAQSLEKAGALYIQIDEPIISTGVTNVKIAKKAVKIITKDLSIPTAMHVCGNVKNILNDILKFNVDIIDCEFAGIPTNINALEHVDIKDKKIGFGCIDTKTDKIETKEEVEELIKRGIELLGTENMLIDPDCGMRMRSRNSALSKLKSMTDAVKNL